MPGNTNAPNITTMNMMNMQTQYQGYINDSYICAKGTGNTTCDGDYNTYRVQNFNATNQYVPTDNCGTRIFSHGVGTQDTNVDVDSGMSTEYTAAQTNFLSW